MLIVCPNCATSYQIEPGLVGASERSVRCARCLTVWTADMRTPLPAMIRAEDSEILAQGPTIPPQERHIAAAAGPARARADGSEAAGAIPDAAAGSPGATQDDPAEPRSEPATEASTSDSLHTAPDTTPGAPSSADGAVGDPRLVETDAPSIVPPQNPEAARSVSRRPRMSRAAKSAAERRAAQSDARSRNKRMTLICFGLALLATGNVGLISYRDAIVRKLPQTASLYAAIGLPVNLRGLAFADLKTSYETKDGTDVLLVKGAIVSESNKPVAVPLVRLAVRNAAHQEIYAWTTKPERASLGPQQRLPFEARLASPPPDAQDVVVRFLSPGNHGPL